MPSQSWSQKEKTLLKNRVESEFAELDEFLPIFIDFFLDLLDHPLVAGLEHVGEAALHLKVVLHGQLALGLIREAVLVLDDFVTVLPLTVKSVPLTSAVSPFFMPDSVALPLFIVMTTSAVWSKSKVTAL